MMQALTATAVSVFSRYAGAKPILGNDGWIFRGVYIKLAINVLIPNPHEKIPN